MFQTDAMWGQKKDLDEDKQGIIGSMPKSHSSMWYYYYDNKIKTKSIKITYMCLTQRLKSIVKIKIAAVDPMWELKEKVYINIIKKLLVQCLNHIAVRGTMTKE